METTLGKRAENVQTPKRNVSEKEQRNTWREDELVWVCWWVRSRDACMEELRESWREANGGQTEHEELACDGSCPGLILSVCAGWQKGCKGRLARPVLTDTHGTFGLIWTESQQIDGLRYLKHWQKQTFCEFSYNHQLQTCSPPHPLDSPLLICPRVLNPLTEFIYTQTVHMLLRHLVLHQQVVGLEKGRSHWGVGSCEGYWFVHGPDSFYPSLLSLYFLLSAQFEGFSLFWHRWEELEKKECCLCGWDKEMPKGM